MSRIRVPYRAVLRRLPRLPRSRTRWGLAERALLVLLVAWLILAVAAVAALLVWVTEVVSP